MRHEPVRILTLAAAWSLFALCCVSPILWMLFGSAGSGSLGALVGLDDARQRSLMANTLLFGLGLATVAFAVGEPSGIVL